MLGILKKIKTIANDPSLLAKYVMTRDIESVRELSRNKVNVKSNFSHLELKKLSEKQQLHFRTILDSVVEILEEDLPKSIESIPQFIHQYKDRWFITYSTTCYLISRLIKPKIVVETGVSEGFSSYLILRSFESNQQGILYSIDYPISENFKTGWMCFDKERKNWELKLGKSKDHLSDILKKTDKIDCFFHDSEHSYSNMMYEFETAWPHIKKGGILFSDDLTPAFDDFIKKLNPKPQLVLKFRTQTNNGLLIK